MKRQQRPEWASKRDREAKLAPMSGRDRLLFLAGCILSAWIGIFLIGFLLLQIAHLHQCHPVGDNLGCGPLGDLGKGLVFLGAFTSPAFVIAILGCLLTAFFSSRD